MIGLTGNETILITSYLTLVIIIVAFLPVSPINNCSQEEPSDCFHDWDLSYECNKQGGWLVPTTTLSEKFWTCANETNSFWTVRAC